MLQVLCALLHSLLSLVGIQAFNRPVGSVPTSSLVPAPSLSSSPYTLVIVDMQPGFPASNQVTTIRACEQLILESVRLGYPIVVLEFEPTSMLGTTHGQLMRKLEGGRYNKYVVETKRADNGAPEVLRACQSRGFATRTFRVCGVNTHACVQATVTGLASAEPSAIIQVIQEACNDGGGSLWSAFQRLDNVLLSHLTPLRA